MLHSFKGKPGETPVGGLIADAAGNFYGTAAESSDGFGVVYQLRKSGNSWVYRVLYDFKTADNGAQPVGNLIFDAVGNLYGVTAFGGTGACDGGCGTVFELSPNSQGGWSESVLYSFQGGSDGANPVGGLVADNQGNFYGITAWGGVSAGYCGSMGCGTVFELGPISGGGWQESILFKFHGRTDGYEPEGALIFDGDGNLYGTTLGGGSGTQGVLFKLSPSSGGTWTQKILFNFDGGPRGGQPTGKLTMDKSGNLYGTTTFGGSGCGFGCGTVFELTPTAEKVLYAFTGGNDGAFPTGSVIFDPKGNLYGTSFSSPNTAGAVFKLTPTKGKWKVTVLEVFSGKNGAYPVGDLTMDSAANLYGTTKSGGQRNFGTVFRVTP
jgi:uncharacterized repeat protein (TIGR03803 family)